MYMPHKNSSSDQKLNCDKFIEFDDEIGDIKINHMA